MRKLVLLALLIPIILFGQENEKFDGVVKINKYANFIQKAYYPNSPFENPFDSLFVIGGIITPSGKKFDIAISAAENGRKTEFYNLDLNLTLDNFETPTISALKKQSKLSEDLVYNGQLDNKSSIYDFILKNIDNTKVLRSRFFSVIVSYKSKGTTLKNISRDALSYSFKTKKFSSNFMRLAREGNYDFYVKLELDDNFEYIHNNNRYYTVQRKMINPIGEYVIKLNIEGMWDGYEKDLDKFYLKH